MATKQKASPRPPSRRSVLKAVGAGITAGGVFSGTGAAGDHTFANELNTVRASTRKYRDLEAAEADGYEFFGIFDFVGVVYSNPENTGNLGHTDPSSLLFYAPTRSGDIEDEDDVTNTNTILAGIEYHVEGRNAGDQDIFADEEASRKLKVTEAEGWHPNPLGAPITGLHVWVHLQNPDGVFAREHPTIRDRLTD